MIEDRFSGIAFARGSRSAMQLSHRHRTLEPAYPLLMLWTAPDLDTYLRNDWEASFARRRAANCYAQLVTWYHGDISANSLYHHDLVRALKAIKARVLLLPSETDLYFRVDDNALEISHLADAELTPIPSSWGHRAGNPASNPRDAAFLKNAVRRWLE